MAIDKKARPAPPPAPADYIPGDPIPAPDAVETNSDSVWDLWHRTDNAHKVGYADTAPASLGAAPPGHPGFAPTEPAGIAKVPKAGAPRAMAAKLPTVDEAMLEARRNNRVCPKPPRWQELYQMLPNRKGSQPTPPLVGASWNATPSISKRMCLREHLEWAESHGALGDVLSFLRQLPEEEWHHMGE